MGIGSCDVVKEEMRKKKAHGLVEIPLTGPPVVSATKKYNKGTNNQNMAHHYRISTRKYMQLCSTVDNVVDIIYCTQCLLNCLWMVCL